MTRNFFRRRLGTIAAAACALATATPALASEDSLKLPDLSSVRFMGVEGRTLLMFGLLICVAGLAFGMFFYQKLRKLPVHKSMLEVSELIYETCKTYLKTQGKFILLLWIFIAAIMVIYFGFLSDSKTHHDATVIGSTVAGVVAAPPVGADAPAV